MTIEEQLSWASKSDSQTAKALTAHTRELLALRNSLDRLSAGQSHMLRTLASALPSTIPTPDLISASSFTKANSFSPISAALAPELVLLFHRLTCFDLPARLVGHLRTDAAWLGDIEGRRADHIQPPPANEVVAGLISLCANWRDNYLKLSSRQRKLHAIAAFHAKLLLLHPFEDGNGRVARALLMQQCLDLFGKADMSLMNKGGDYYAALKAADSEDYHPLVILLEPVVRT